MSGYFPEMVSAAEQLVFPPEQLDFFEKKIRPVLLEQCAKCHSAQGEKIKGGLVIDSRAAMLKGGDTGPAIIAGDPDKSLMIQAVRYKDEDLQMPPKHRLSVAQVADFEAWVKMGAPDPRDGAAPAAKAGYNWEEARKFCSSSGPRNLGAHRALTGRRAAAITRRRFRRGWRAAG